MKDKDLEMLRKLSENLESVKDQIDAKLRRELWHEEIKVHQIATTHLSGALEHVAGPVKDVRIQSLNHRWGKSWEVTGTYERFDEKAIISHTFHAFVDVNFETITNVTVTP